MADIAKALNEARLNRINENNCFNKAAQVVRSCMTREQYLGAGKYIGLALKGQRITKGSYEMLSALILTGLCQCEYDRCLAETALRKTSGLLGG